MIRARHFSMAVLVFVVAAGVALAGSWYDDYDEGTNAAKKGNWAVVVQKMTSAINGYSKENDKARTYGAIFINYHPYYYRGVAYLNLGKYEQAIADLEKTSGRGEDDFGAIEMLMQRAKTKLAAATAPAQEPPPAVAQQPPRPTPVTPVPVTPAGPVIDQALRGRVAAAVQKANTSLAGARNRKAGSSPQYAQAVRAMTDANTRLNTAKSNDDLNNALASAENAALLADSAVAPGMPSPPMSTAAVVTPRAAAATEAAISDYKTTLRAALNNYFAGEFETAEREFIQLSQKMPNNGWIWAFLGASQYSRYAFEADETHKKAAVDSFVKAKRTRSWKGGLPERYFSKRIRKFFETVGG